MACFYDILISIGGRKINNLRFADDTTLIAGIEEELGDLVSRVKGISLNFALEININKLD